MDNQIDYAVLNELAVLRDEKKAAEAELDAQKYTFQHSLMAGMGERMMEQLKSPKKPSKKIGRAYRKARKQTIKDNKKQMKGGF